MTRNQINFALTDAQMAVLGAVAYVEDSKPTGYLKDLAVAHLEALSSDPDVRAAMKARAEFQGRKSGKVSKLEERKKKVAEK